MILLILSFLEMFQLKLNIPYNVIVTLSYSTSIIKELILINNYFNLEGDTK